MKLSAAVRAPGAPAFRSTRASLRRSGKAVAGRKMRLQPIAALEMDWSDPETQIAGLGALFGILLGVGVPAFYIARDERDDERLEEIRALNRATKEATGEYMTREEIAKIRPPHWTDGKEFVDDD